MVTSQCNAETRFSDGAVYVCTKWIGHGGPHHAYDAGTNIEFYRDGQAVDLTSVDDPKVIDALTRCCNICGADHGIHCRDLQGEPLAGGQLVHMARPK